MQIANEKMTEAIRKISVSKGFDAAEYGLVAFGGAGGMHACAIANLLNMSTIIIPADAGLLSAYGISKSKLALHYLVMLNEVLGEAWMNNEWFRFGASSLAISNWAETIILMA